MVILYAILGRHFTLEVDGTFLPHIPCIPRDMFLVHFVTLWVGFALRDYLRGRFVLADLLPYEIADFQCFLRHDILSCDRDVCVPILNQIQ